MTQTRTYLYNLSCTVGLTKTKIKCLQIEAYSITQIIQMCTCLCPVENFLVLFLNTARKFTILFRFLTAKFEAFITKIHVTTLSTNMYVFIT